MKKRHIFGFIILALLGPALILGLRSPSQDRDWKPDYARLPEMVEDSGIYDIRNIRDFRFDEKGAVTKAAYHDRRYALSDLRGLWFGISHFTDYGLAHTFLSFEFENAPPLVVSVEARMEKGESYSPLRGLLREYELIFLLTTEQDTIGARTHQRGERVLLYKLQAGAEERANLFKAMMARVKDLETAPEFYNTLSDNCTTSLARHATRLSDWQRLFDYRILLPGFSDGLAQEEGLLPAGVTLEELRARAWLDPARTDLEDPDFSSLIRGH